MDAVAALRPYRADEVDRFGELQPGRLHRDEQGPHLAVGYVQGVDRVIETVVDLVADIRAGLGVSVNRRMIAANSANADTGRVEGLAGRYRGEVKAIDRSARGRIDRQLAAGQVPHVDVVAVLVRHQNRVASVQGLGFA